MLQNLIVGPVNGLFVLLAFAVLAVKVFALVDAARRPQRVWQAAIEQSKTMWLVILALSCVFGGLGLLGIAALVATILYLVDVRPKLLAAQGQGPSRW